MNNFGKRLLSSICQKRKFHTTQVRLIDPKTVEEVRIPVPWGHIAGKWWGCKTGSPVLAVHGYFDNANSFDRLIPHLDVQGVLCIDLPGHGNSSFTFKGFVVNYIDHIMNLRYLLKHSLKWNDVTFISHSFGSSICFAYAGLFPDDVRAMVNIECGRLSVAGTVEDVVETLRESIEASLSNNDEKPKGYSWKETIEHTYSMRSLVKLPLSKESCELIAKRGTTKVQDADEYRFSVDSRMKVRHSGRLRKNEFLELSKLIKCDILNIVASNGVASIKGENPLMLLPIIPDEVRIHHKTLEQSARKFVNLTIETGHHVHLEEPEKVFPLINDFLR